MRACTGGQYCSVHGVTSAETYQPPEPFLRQAHSPLHARCVQGFFGFGASLLTGTGAATGMTWRQMCGPLGSCWRS